MGWIGVDLDGTLATYDGWNGPDHIGEPVKMMHRRVMCWLGEGREVRVLTARASIPEQIPPVRKWLDDHGMREVGITCSKDFEMIELWDDRCVRIITNTGERCCEK